MHPLLSAAALSISLGSLAAVADDKAPMVPQTVEQGVIAADDADVAAEETGDVAAMRALIDERFVCNSDGGKTFDREDFLESVLRMGIVGHKVRERSVVVEGDVAMMFATTDMTLGASGKPASTSAYRYTCVYVNRQGRWRMLALQMQPRAAD